MPQADFITEHSFEKRCELSARLRNRYPDRVPVIISTQFAEKEAKIRNQMMKSSAKGSSFPGSSTGSSPDKKRTKFLVPSGLHVSHLLLEIRKSWDLAPEDALFLYVGSGALVPMTWDLGSIYSKFQAEDGFLYLEVAKEATFG